MLLIFPCSCSWTALLAVGSWKIFPVAVPGNTLLQPRQCFSCWSWMAQLAIITSRRRSWWHVVMHAVEIEVSGKFVHRRNRRRRMSIMVIQRHGQRSMVNGQWYQKSIYQKEQWKRLLERLWPRKKKRRFLPSFIYFVSDMRIRQLNFSSRRFSHVE